MHLIGQNGRTVCKTHMGVIEMDSWGPKHLTHGLGWPPSVNLSAPQYSVDVWASRKGRGLVTILCRTCIESAVL